MARKAEPKAVKSGTGGTPKKPAPRGTAVRPVPAEKWRAAFLSDLAENCNVTNACRAAGVGRNTVYEHRKTDQGFAAAWDDAVEQGIERLELVARNRALTVSDTLAIFLLKAHRPKVYRDSAAGTDDDPVTHRHTVEYVNDWRGAGRGDG